MKHASEWPNPEGLTPIEHMQVKTLACHTWRARRELTGEEVVVRAFPRYVQEGHYGIGKDDLLPKYKLYLKVIHLTTSWPPIPGIVPWQQAHMAGDWLVLVRSHMPQKLADRYPPGGPSPPAGLVKGLATVVEGVERLKAMASDAMTHVDCRVTANNLMATARGAALCDWHLDRPTELVEEGMAPIPIHYDVGSFGVDSGLQHEVAVAYHVLRTGRLPWPGDGFGDVWRSSEMGKLDLSGLALAERDPVRRALDTEWSSCTEFLGTLQGL